jgi:hypothetical protein
MAPSQPIAGVEIETASGKEAEPDRDKQQIKHWRDPYRLNDPVSNTAAAHSPESIIAALASLETGVNSQWAVGSGTALP